MREEKPISEKGKDKRQSRRNEGREGEARER